MEKGKPPMKADILLRAVAVAALVLTANTALSEDIAPVSEGAGAEDGYVDPGLKTRGRCKDHPGRPRWMMEHPIEFMWRAELASEFRSVQRAEAVSEAGTCDCDMLYPDWNVYRAEIEAMWNEVSTESKWDWDDETRERFNATRDRMNDYSRPLLPMVTRLCSGLE